MERRTFLKGVVAFLGVAGISVPAMSLPTAAAIPKYTDAELCERAIDVLVKYKYQAINVSSFSGFTQIEAGTTIHNWALARLYLKQDHSGYQIEIMDKTKSNILLKHATPETLDEVIGEMLTRAYHEFP